MIDNNATCPAMRTEPTVTTVTAPVTNRAQGKPTCRQSRLHQFCMNTRHH